MGVGDKAKRESEQQILLSFFNLLRASILYSSVNCIFR